MAKYPLEQVTQIKKKRLDEAERVLADKKRILEEEEKKLAQAEKERDEVQSHKQDKIEQLREEFDQGTTTGKIDQMKTYIKVVEEQLHQKEMVVERHKKLVKAAEEEVEKARQVLFQKQKEMEKMRYHRKEWEEELAKEAIRQEGIAMDELGSGMHTLRKRKKRKS